MHINLNWFLGVLAIELWIAPYLMIFWPDIVEAWSRYRDEWRIRGYVRAYERRQRGLATGATIIYRTIDADGRHSA